MKLISFILFFLFNFKSLLKKKKNSINYSFLNHTFKNRYLNKNFIICLPGKSLERHYIKLNNAKNHDQIIITCNKANKLIDPNYQLFTNRKRFLTSDLKKNSCLFSPEMNKIIINKKLTTQKYDYIPSVNLISNFFNNFLFIFKDFIFTNNASSGITAISLAILMGAKKITIYGMDGYKNDNNHFYYEVDTKNSIFLKKREKINSHHIEILKKISYIKKINFEIIK